MAEQIALFGLVVGIALLLSGIGFIILALVVLGKHDKPRGDRQGRQPARQKPARRAAGHRPLPPPGARGAAQAAPSPSPRAPRRARRRAPSVAAATMRERPSRSSGAAAEGRILEELDREPALPHEQLGRGDVDRARRLEAADGVDAPGRKVAERQRERAHHAEPLRNPHHRRRQLGDRGGRRSLEGEDLDRAPSGQASSSGRTVEQRARAPLGDPLLARRRSRGRTRTRRRPSWALARPRARARSTGSRASR